MLKMFLSVLIIVTVLLLLPGCKGIKSESKAITTTDIFNKGMSYYYSRNFDDALLMFKKIRPESNEYKKSLVMSAKSLFFLNKDREAIKLLEKAVAEYPEYPDALYWMGKVYFFNGYFNKAEVYLSRSIEIDSNNMDSLYLLGEIYRNSGDYERAIMLFDEVEGQLDLIALSKLRKAQIFLESGQKEKAIDAIDFVKNNRSYLSDKVRDLAVKLASKYSLSKSN